MPSQGYAVKIFRSQFAQFYWNVSCYGGLLPGFKTLRSRGLRVSWDCTRKESRKLTIEREGYINRLDDHVMLLDRGLNRTSESLSPVPTSFVTMEPLAPKVI